MHLFVTWLCYSSQTFSFTLNSFAIMILSTRILVSAISVCLRALRDTSGIANVLIHFLKSFVRFFMMFIIQV